MTRNVCRKRALAAAALASMLGLGCSSGGGARPPSDAGGDGGPSAHSVRLTWKASSTPGVTYDLYRGVTPGGPYEEIQSGISTIQTTDKTVSSGTTYYYVARSQDSSGQSVNSNEVKAVVP
jgi:hypothetical protein